MKNPPATGGFERSRSGAVHGPVHSVWRSWLQLIRLPNLLTVPGDPIAGFLLASAVGVSEVSPGAGIAFFRDGLPFGPPFRASIAAAAALLLYMYGLIGNDVRDLEEDRRERPERPLPAGRIRVRSAKIVSGTLAATGTGLAALCGYVGFALAAALVAAVFLYNAGMKRYRVAGPLFMGLCRSLSLLLGAAAAGWSGECSVPVWAAVCLGLYVAAVTAVAARETRSEGPGRLRWLPAMAAAAGFVAFGLSVQGAEIAGALWTYPLGGAMALRAGYIGFRLGRRPRPGETQASIGQWLRGLLLLQCGFAAIGSGNAAAPGAVLLALWTLHARLARRFSCS